MMLVALAAAVESVHQRYQELRNDDARRIAISFLESHEERKQQMSLERGFSRIIDQPQENRAI